MPRTTFPTTLGRCALRWNDTGLTGFELPEASALPDDEPVCPAEIVDLTNRITRHLLGELQDFSELSYDFAGTPTFNVAVLRATLAVKPGETRTYGDIARHAGHSTAASRAVGAALGANRWPLLIPCHRVVSANGKMTGFSGPGGIATKLRLLKLEGAQLFDA